eukprot:snap_masked-scaffold_21-processed-gene-5.69-mRNA-1 protein AED:1.00 eAED:1.00 QI:0/-1/0/0/-1/1/1/0/239
MSLFDKFPPTEEIREFVLNEYFSYMEEHELPYSTVGVRMVEVADKSRLKHLNRNCPAFRSSCGFLFLIFICYMPDESMLFVWVMKLGALLCLPLAFLKELLLLILWIMKCTVFSHLKENFYGKQPEIKELMTQSVVVDDNGFFFHRRNNISKEYENCFYTAFGWKQKEQYALETVQSYYVQKDDIEAIDISSQFHLPGKYYSGFKEDYWFILTPEVSQFFSIKPMDPNSVLMALGFLES